MHAYRPGSGQARTKLLYLFRSPSHILIGRKPLDPEVREALEHTHPDLTFDWNGLLRDNPTPVREPRVDPTDPRERRGRGARPQKSAKPAGPPAGRSTRQAPSPPELPPDDSALGQALGPAEAARLRHRYAELAQRIGRRARTPEERDRLMGELAGSNPDGWGGAETIRQQARGADRQWEAISAQLPKRRRGRRGGKTDDPDQIPSGDVIIGERDSTNESTAETDAIRVDAAGDGSAQRPADSAAHPGPDHTTSDVR